MCGVCVLLPSSVAVVVGAAAFVMSIINSTSYEKGWQKNCVSKLPLARKLNIVVAD